MILQALEPEFSVCKAAKLPEGVLDQEFCFVGKTDEELSLVCPVTALDGADELLTHRDDGWKAFRFAGELDFSLTGILAAASAVLAEMKIGIFAISTYNTDYVLVRTQNFEAALDALEQAGYQIER